MVHSIIKGHTGGEGMMAEHNQQFDSFEQWVNKASSWLTRHPSYDGNKFRAICHDQKGRCCQNGKDFMLARDENMFPITWRWPDQDLQAEKTND